MAGTVAHDPIGHPMSAGQQPRIEYVEARRMLLDALTAGLDEPRRLQSKDAGDVYLLVDATPVAAMATAIRGLLVDSLTMSTTEQALAYLARLFRSASSPGTKLAARALSGVIDPQTVTSIVARYTRELLDQTRPGAGSWAVSPREGSYGHD